MRSTDALLDFTKFRLIRVLAQHPTIKLVALLGVFEDLPGQAIVLAERTHFTEEQIGEFGLTIEHPRVIELNSIYHRFVVSSTSKYSDTKLMVIHPATDLHILKYTFQPKVMLTETPEEFATKILPYLRSLPASRLEWIENIIDRKSEVESSIHVDMHPENGFILVPDR